LIFSYSVERSIGIGMSLAGGVPMEDLSPGYPAADWDTVVGDMLLEQKSATGITQRYFKQPLHTHVLPDQAALPIYLPQHQDRRPFAVPTRIAPAC
jgi:hypothetical protein